MAWMLGAFAVLIALRIAQTASRHDPKLAAIDAKSSWIAAAVLPVDETLVAVFRMPAGEVPLTAAAVLKKLESALAATAASTELRNALGTRSRMFK